MRNEGGFLALSRRQFLASATAVAAISAIRSQRLMGQAVAAEPAVVVQGRAAGAAAKIKTVKLRGGVFVLEGSGGNIAVLSGGEGKLLVDSGFSTSRQQISDALHSLSPEPVERLVNTHWHFDHTDGNEWMHGMGATIFAHEKTRTRMSSPQEIAAFQAHFPASPAGAVPTEVFADKKTLRMNGQTIELAHYEAAHTDTDISVYFADADVLHTGDTWFNGTYPFIDYSTGGHIDGMIRAAGKNLGLGTEDTIIIPGHGPVGDKTQLAAWRTMLVEVRGKVSTMKKSGRTLEASVASKPTAEFDAKYNGGSFKADQFVALVYQGV